MSAASRPRSVSLAERIATTIGAPLVMLAADRVPMPYLHEPALTRGAGAVPLPSIVALGLMPLLTAYALVEMAALVVPSWRRARHHPAVRARLERFATVLAIVLALMQGLSLVLA